MPPDIGVLPLAFTIAAIVAGCAAIAGLFLAIALYLPSSRKTPPVAPLPTRNPDAILLMLQGMTHVATAAGRLFGVLGRVAAIALAVLSLASLAFAALLLATGRGLDAHEDWARVTAVVVSTAVTVGSSGLVLSTRGWWRVLMLLLVAGAIYALVASVRGYG